MKTPKVVDEVRQIFIVSKCIFHLRLKSIDKNSLVLLKLNYFNQYVYFYAY